jgi:hypothetical protein
MDQFATSLGKAICTVATVGGNAPECYNATAMHTLGTCVVLAVALVTLGYRALSRF